MEQNRYKGFKDLDCWKEARKLREEMTWLARSFPVDEKYLLTNQLIRSARSVTANIAEGYGRFTYADTRHFFIQSRGSLTEVIDHLTVALDEHYISHETFSTLEIKCALVFKLINGYIGYLDRSRENRPNS